MLQSIREKSQGWFAWIIISALCLTFALWGIHSYLYGNAADQTVAKVNGVKVSQMELSRSYNQLKREMIMRLGEQSALQIPSKLLKQSALHSLVNAIVIDQGAQHAGFEAGPGLLEYTIANMPIFQRNGQFSKERFKEVVGNMLYSTASFLEQLKGTIVVNQVQEGIKNTNFTLPNEIRDAAQLIQQKRRFQYLLIHKSNFLKDIKISNQEITDYYKNNQKSYQLPEKVSIEYLQLSLNDLMKRIHPTEQQLKDYYQSNLSAYTLPKKWQVKSYMISIPVGTTPKDLTTYQKKANNIYQQLKTSKTANDLPKPAIHWLTLGDLAPNMHSALLALKKTGDISLPMKTQTGYVIFQLIKVQTSKTLPFSAVKTKVADAYKQQKAQMKFDDLNDQLANKTYESPNSLAPAAKSLGLTVQKTGLFTKDQKNLKGILKYPAVVTSAFSDEVLNESNNSDPVNLDSNDVIVLRINKHIPARLKPISEVKASIEKKLLDQKAREKAAQLGATLTKAMQKAPKNLNQLAKQHHLSWKNSGLVSADTKGLNSEVLMLAYSLPRSSRVVQGTLLNNGDFAIVNLTDIQLGSEKSLNPAHQKALKMNLKQSLSQTDYQLYVHGLMQDAKIKYYNKK